jgi:large repetitive protein
VRAKTLFRPFIAGVVTIVLVTTVISPVAALERSESASTADVSFNPDDVPALESPTIESDLPASPQGSFDAPLTIPEPIPTKPAPLPEFDEGSAKVTDRDETSTTYTDKNGVNQTELSSVVVNVKDASGKWVAPETALKDDGASGLTVSRHPLAPRFAPTASDPRLFQVTRDGYTISFALDGAANAQRKQSVVPFTNTGNDRTNFDSVFPDTDLHYEVQKSSVKESIVIKKLPSPKRAVYTWTVTAPGLRPVKNDFGSLEFQSGSGEVVFTMPIPTMWDSTGRDSQRSRMCRSRFVKARHLHTRWC